MKIIFDIGANKGQNFKYFFEKSDLVIAFEANPNLVEKIKLEFKQFIKEKKLIVVNVALSDKKKNKKIKFYISKENDLLSTCYPDNKNNFYKKDIRCEKASFLIKKYLKIFKISKIEYIKIDIEGSDHLILEDLLKNKILAENLSVESYEHEVIELLLNSSYKSFKFVEGENLSLKKNIKINTKRNKKKLINFDVHSSGPYGDDIPGNYFGKESIIPYFLNKGLGWTDIHCVLNKKKNLKKIKYIEEIHLRSFRHQLKNILISFVKLLKFRIYRIFKL